MEEQKYLEIQSNNGHILTVKDEIQNKAEFMYPAYRRAKEIIENIIANSFCLLSKGHLLDMDLYRYSGNIIAISGRRGQGKTSTMLTLSNALTKEQKNNQEKGWLAGTSFIALDPIDPTVLESGQSPLMLILSRMYRMAENAWNSGRDNGKYDRYSENEKNKLINLFQKCLTGINASKNEKRDHLAGLYEMHELSDSAQLKRCFYDLSEQLLSFCSNSSRGNKYLIIQLDDTDFQIERSYEILEDIRRYLTLPNILIIMATDLEILYDVIAQHFFKQMSVAKSNKLISRQELMNHTHKYLDKLIPPSNIVTLPQMDLAMMDSESFHLVFKKDDQEVLKGAKDLPFHSAVFWLLYEKTGIMLIKEETAKAFLPGTLRGLSQLLNFLAQMDDIHEEKPEKLRDRKSILHALKRMTEIQDYNLERFEAYFLSTWLKSKLTNEKEKATYARVRINADDINVLFDQLKRIPNDDRYKHISNFLEEKYTGSPKDKQKDEQAVTETDNRQKRMAVYCDFWNYMQEQKKKYPLAADQYIFSAIEIWLTILWQKSVLRQQRKEITRIEKEASNENDAIVINYAPGDIGLPFPYFPERIQYHNSEDAKLPIEETISKMDSASYARINECLCYSNRFHMLNFVRLLLNGDEKKTEKDEYILQAEDINIVYQAQQMAVRIATNPEVIEKLTEAETKGSNENKNKDVTDYLLYLVGELARADQSIYSATTTEQVDDSLPMVHKWPRFDIVSSLLKMENSYEDGSNEIELTLLPQWYASVTKSDRVKKQQEMEKAFMDLLKESRYEHRDDSET